VTGSMRAAYILDRYRSIDGSRAPM